MPPPRVMIPDLPLKSEPEDTDELIIQDAGGTKKTTVANVRVQFTPSVSVLDAAAYWEGLSGG